MGKDLKGKELGVGLSQRKDGRYSARYTSKCTGKVIQKYFDKLQECRNWYADATFQDENCSIGANPSMTVDEWIEYWLENIKSDNIRYNTKVAYINCQKRVRKHIGNITLEKIKPMHIQQMANELIKKYSNSTVTSTLTILKSSFDFAVENDVIMKNPVTKSIKKYGYDKRERVLTIEEHRNFLEYNKGLYYYNVFALILQTGLRISELIGLTWDCVDISRGYIRVEKTLNMRNKDGHQWGKPKTKAGYRDIPLTDDAKIILKNQQMKFKSMKIRNIEFPNCVFYTEEGNPLNYKNLNLYIDRYCKKFNVEKFSLHTLRHTFATRCAEGDIKPKALQAIMGHSNIQTTLDIYVHLTDDEREKEMHKIEQFLKVV